jgi:hypothetical protein
MTGPNDVSTLRLELKKVLDKIESDTAYRQRLLDDPREALAAVMDTNQKGAPDLLTHLNAPNKPTPCKGKVTCLITCLFTCGPVYKTCGGSNKKITEE